MISYQIKTWRCSCGYAQDFEPTIAAMNKHFNRDKGFPLTDMAENECPSCALKGIRGAGLPKCTDLTKKSVHNLMEVADAEADIENLVNEPVRKVEIGKEFRLESNDEKSERISQEEAKLAHEEDKAAHRVKSHEKIMREFPRLRDETVNEKTARIAEHAAGLVALSAAQVQALRDKHEDV